MSGFLNTLLSNTEVRSFKTDTKTLWKIPCVYKITGLISGANFYLWAEIVSFLSILSLEEKEE